MLNVGTAELLVILLVALIVLGPSKLPTAARQMGRAVGELRRMSSGFQAEMRDAFREAEVPTSEPPPSYESYDSIAPPDGRSEPSVEREPPPA